MGYLLTAFSGCFFSDSGSCASCGGFFILFRICFTWSCTCGSPLPAATFSNSAGLLSEDTLREDLSSTESLRDMSCTSRSESPSDSSAGMSSNGVSVCHCGCLILQAATLVRYVRQCSGHENRCMFRHPFLLQSCHRYFSATSFSSASAMAFWSCGSTSNPLFSA